MVHFGLGRSQPAFPKYRGGRGETNIQPFSEHHPLNYSYARDSKPSWSGGEISFAQNLGETSTHRPVMNSYLIAKVVHR